MHPFQILHSCSQQTHLLMFVNRSEQKISLFLRLAAGQEFKAVYLLCFYDDGSGGGMTEHQKNLLYSCLKKRYASFTQIFVLF